MPDPSPHHPTGLPDPLKELAAERLLAASASERAAVLATLVRAHPGFAEPLERLAHDLAGAERLLDEGFHAPPAPLAVIGPYRVLGTIGEGAFGVVYRCAQDAPLRREVAVKVLRPGTGDRHTLARFEVERHLLARLNHPAIGQVFDAGALPDGRPWFAMEYVRGLPITTWCDRDCLSVDARLRLFVRLCQGVHHAHDQGIVHRDLKPANILVFAQDGQPQPRIIDFGIAKALDPTDAPQLAAGPRTETGRVIGTPGYMSPEQSGGSHRDLDARADVFSLGVVLYELLTGELPWGRRPQTTDGEPPRPSSRVGTDPSGTLARTRALPARRLASRLRGDLDWIVLKAIAREREHRYASAQELADDLLRHLAGRPVLAGPPALRYRARKFIRRHRLAAFTLAAALAVAGPGVWLGLQFRATAMTWAADVEAAATALMARARDRTLVGAPQSGAVRKALVQDALVLYAKLLRERPQDPGLRVGRARALGTLSQVHWLLGEHEGAAAAAQEAVTEAEGLLAAAPERLDHRVLLANTLRSLGRATASSGRVAEARTALARAVREFEACVAQAPGRHEAALALTLRDRAGTLTADETAEASAMLERAMALLEQVANATTSDAGARSDLLDVLVALASQRLGQGDLHGASQSVRQADELLARLPAASPGQACAVLAAGATLAARRGNAPTALDRLHKAIAAAERWVAQEPAWQEPRKRLLELRGALVQQYSALGDAAAVVNASRAAIATAEAMATRFPEDPMAIGQLAGHLSALATALLPLGRRDVLAEAEDCARRALQVSDTVPASVDESLRSRARWLFRSHLGIVLDARGSAEANAVWAQTEPALHAWLARTTVGAGDAPAVLETSLHLVRWRLATGDANGAAALLDQAEALLRQHGSAIGDQGRLGAEVCWLRARVAQQRGDDQAAAAAGEQAQAMRTWHGMLAAGRGLVAAWQAARNGAPAARARAAGHRDRAIALHRAALATLRAGHEQAPEDPWRTLPMAQVAAQLALLLQDQGDAATAAPLLAEARPLLESLRTTVHADRWDEALYQSVLAATR